MEYRLGLDIGIASVGWGIVDENNNIIDAGVRLFPEASKDGNVGRREKRSSRRLLRRRQHRLERVRKLLLDNNIIDCIEYNFYVEEQTPYHYRVKGLEEKLSKRDLAIALYHLAKRRGLHEFSGFEEENEKASELSTKQVLFENEKLTKDKYVCEIQLERLLRGEIDLVNGRVRGVKNRFRTSDYVKEGKKILETQKTYYQEIDDEFMTKYINLLEQRRNYYDGPGRQANGDLSPYGWEKGEFLERMMGKCKYFPEELRISKASYTAQLFNLLNDLNNLSIKRDGNSKLSFEEKNNIVEICKKQKSISISKIAKELDVNKEDILGYRVDKSNKALFTSLMSYNEINKYIECDNRKILDDISKIITVAQSPLEKTEELRKYLNKIDYKVDDKIIEEMAKDLNYSGTHSLSKKAIDLALDELWETSKNQMQIYNDLGLVPYKMDFKGKRKIPKDYIEEWILSPVVKRSMSQSINVINSVIKKHGIPEEIVIELAREKNSEDKRKFLNDLQKKNEKENNDIRDLLKNRRVDKNLFSKLKYWKSQDGKCMYSSDEIPIEHIINYPENYEIDHIIPRSISFDDSQNNKVLVKRVENQNKGNLSPYMYLKSGKGKISYEVYKANVMEHYKNNRISKAKRDMLLFEDELNKYAAKFIARNLVDTRYATRELMNMLKKYFIDNEQNVKIKSINGKVTSQIRKMWNFPKNRELSHKHHAQDALIVLGAEKLSNQLRWVKDYFGGENEKIDLRTGEIRDDKEFRKLFEQEYKYGDNIKSYTDYKYSNLVEKRPNRQLVKETVYSTRTVKTEDKKGRVKEEEYYIGKISNIYDERDDKPKKFVTDKKKREQLLIYHNDKQSFGILEKICEQYPKAKNPFAEFKKEHGFIKKYSKKDNGPIIKNLKYRVKKLGAHFDISDKYGEFQKPKGKKVVMLSIPTYRMDVYKKNNEFKFVSVTYLMVKDKDKQYEIDIDEYNKKKKDKKIDNKFEYQFSLYKGDRVEITKENKDKELTIEKVKFKGVNNESRNCIEVDFISKNYSNYINLIKEIKDKIKEIGIEKKLNDLNELIESDLKFSEAKEFLENIVTSSTQKIITIGKDIKNLKKIYVDILGKEYSSKEKFNLKIKK